MKTLITVILLLGIQVFAQSPIISVEPDSLIENLFYARSSTQTLTISNTGSSDLIYQIEPNILPRENYQNYALQFDGVDDYVNVPDSGSLDLVNEMTIEAWFFWTATGAEWPCMIAKGPANENYALYLNKSGRFIHVVLSTQYGREEINSPGNIVMPDSWHHVAVTYNGIVVRIFLDGQLVTEQSFIRTLTTNQKSLMIGYREESLSYFDGQIDEVRIWDVSRTEQEINQHVFRELSGNEEGLVGYWQFNEGIGDTTYDKSLNGNSGNLKGGTQWVQSSAPVAPYFWIMVNPDSGVVAPGSFVDLETSFNAAGRSSGDYDAELIITSNDPVTPEQTIPVHLTIIDAPAIFTETDSINFGEVFIGVTDTFYLDVTNIGSQDLLIISTEIQPNEYIVTPAFAGIDPGESETFTITFLTQTVGDFSGTLKFNSNDPAYSSYIINLNGSGVEPPIIVVSPDLLIAELLAGQSITEKLNINNNGPSNLNFKIDPGISSNDFSLQFDGFNDYVNVTAANSLNFVNELTIEAWFKWTGEGSDDWPAIVCKGHADSENYALFINKWGSLIHFVINTEYGRQYIESPYNGILPNIWHYVAVTYDGSIVKINVDGQFVTEQFITGTLITNNESVMIACRDSSECYFDGQIDEVRLWNIARTEQEINKYMFQELSGNEQGLEGYWQFNEGVGDTAYDKTANENNGSLRGGASWIESSAPIKPSWLSASPDSGICLPNSSMGIEILFDATEVDSGDFDGSIIITSNDPVNPIVIVPVRMIVTAVVGIDDEIKLPTEFLLSQNYPNPFNPSTKIKYSVPQSSNVELKVFDILGNEIETLVNEEKSAGNYEVTWFAESLPSGVYFYQLKAGSFVETKKMLLLK